MDVRTDGFAEERNDHPVEAVDTDDVVREEATELRPSFCELVRSGIAKAEPTTLQSLLEHSLDHIRAVPCQQRLDMPHGLLRDLYIVLHVAGGVEAWSTGKRGLEQCSLTFLAYLLKDVRGLEGQRKQLKHERCAKRRAERHSSVAALLGAKEWMNVCPV